MRLSYPSFILPQAFPKNMQNEEQREILSLLCKVQELQVENMDMQSSCVLRNFEIAKRDMAVDMYEGHKDLCREIILQQRALMEENNICGPKELDDLYELYQHEYSNFSLPDINAHKVLSCKFLFIAKISMFLMPWLNYFRWV